MLSKKKVLFKVSGSFELGFGHIKRSVTLADEMAKHLGIGNIFIFCSCPDETIKVFLKPYEFILKDRDEGGLVDYIKMRNINILVIDEIKDNVELCKALKSLIPTLTIICFDYYNYDNAFVDVIISSFNHDVKIENPRERFKGMYYEGLEYSIIRDGFLPYIEMNKKIKPAVDKVLISFGGADAGGNTMKSLNLLEDAGYDNRADVVIGPFFRNRQNIVEHIKGKRYTCFVYENIHNIERYIYEADLGFIGSGTTMMEFCSIGTPAMIMPQNSKEYKFAKFFESNKAVRVLDSDDKANISLIGDIMGNRELREVMSKSGRELIDGYGKERITSIILEA